MLVNNAGTVFDKRTVTGDGHEATFQVNHLAGFLLTELLLDRIVASAPARIVITASAGHYGGTMDFDDLGFERGYQIMRAYNRSKLANVAPHPRPRPSPRGHRRHREHAAPGRGRDEHLERRALVRPPGARASASGSSWSSPRPAASGSPTSPTGPEVEGRTGGYYQQNALKEPAALALDDALGARLDAVSRELVGLVTTTD